MKHLILLTLLASTSITAEVSASDAPPIEKPSAVAVGTTDKDDAIIRRYNLALVPSNSIKDPSPRLQDLISDWIALNDNIRERDLRSNALVKQLKEQSQSRSPMGLKKEEQTDVLWAINFLKTGEELQTQYTKEFEELIKTQDTAALEQALQGMIDRMKKTIPNREMLNLMPVELFIGAPGSDTSAMQEYGSSADFRGFKEACREGNYCEEAARKREMSGPAEVVKRRVEDLNVQELNAMGRPISLRLNIADYVSSKLDLTDGTIEAIKNLAQLTHLRELIIDQDKGVIDPTPLFQRAIEELTAVLPSLSSNLRAFQLGFSNLGAAGTGLAAALRTLSHLEVLDISNANFDAAGIEFLTAALSTMHDLRVLDISNANLNAAGIEFLTAALSTMHNLRELDVSNNKLDAAGIRLGDALRDKQHLQYLSLKNTGLNPATIKELAAVLPLMPDLRNLSLIDIQLGAAGINTLRPAFQALQKLEVLFLTNTGLDDAEAMELLISVLKTMKSLQRVVVRNKHLRIQLETALPNIKID